MGALVPRSVGFTLSTSLFLGVTYRTSDGKGPKTIQGKRKRGMDGDSKALHQGRGGSPPPTHTTAAAPGPSRLGQQDPKNTAPSEDAANSQHQTSKTNHHHCGAGSCLVPFSPCADSQARTYQLLLFQEEQRRQGPLWTLEARVKFRW